MALQKKKGQEAKYMQRRTQVAQLIIGGYSYRQIAKTLKCSLTTVHRDYQAIKEEWRQDLHSEDLYQWRMKELAKVAAMERVLRPYVWEGRIEAIKQQLSLMKYRAELLGLYAAIRHEVSGKVEMATDTRDLSHVPTADLEQVLAEVDRILGKEGT